MTLRYLLLIALASLTVAMVAMWFSLHVAKGVARAQVQRMEQIELESKQ